METTIESPPRTMMEVYKGLPEGTPVQLIENNLVMAPAPLYMHQRISNDINVKLSNFVNKNQLGEVLEAPFDVYLDDENIFQPDIMFISNDNKDIIGKDGLHGAPDLVIEILSPATAKYDLHHKKNVYERSGVKEFWIVEPESKETKGYFLKEGGYGEPLILEGKIRFELLDLEIEF